MLVEPLVFLILCLCSARIVRLIVFDSLFGAHPDSGSSFSRVLDGWAWRTDGSDRSWLRGKAGTLLTCVYCCGLWLSVGVTCGWTRLWPWELGVEGWITATAVAGGQSLLNVADRKMSD